MAKGKDIERTLEYQASGKLSFWQSLTKGKGLGRVVAFGFSVSITVGVMAAVISVEQHLYDNPELRERLELEQSQLQALHLDMTNPWGLAAADDPISFLLGLLGSADPSMRQKFRTLLASLPEDRLALVAYALGAIELSEVQKQKFARLLMVALEGQGGIKRVERFFDIVEVLTKAKGEGEKTKSKRDSSEAQQGVAQQEAGPLVVIEGEEGTSLLTFLEVQDPPTFKRLLEVIMSLPDEVYEDVMDIAAGLSDAHTEILLNIVTDLSAAEIEVAIGVLVRVSDAGALLDHLEPMNSLEVAETTRSLSSLSTIQLNSLLDLTLSFNGNEFESIINLLNKLSLSDMGIFIGVGEKVGPKTFADVTLMTDQFAGGVLPKLVGVLDNVDKIAVKEVVRMDSRIGLDYTEDAIGILDDLRHGTTQEDFLEETSVLTNENLEKGVEVLREVETETVADVVDISQGLEKPNIKNMMADQFHRLTEPTAVAGVRGKAKAYQRKVSARSKSSSASSRSSKSVRRDNTSRQRIERVERLVQKLVDINDDELNQDLFENSTDLSEESLARGTEVFIRLDIGPNEERAHRLVGMYARTNLNRKEAAIDTLHDIQDPQVEAAIDLAHISDDDLVNDSIDYAENLKFRLGTTNGLDATSRLINVASRVDTHEQRRKGLDALSNEREVRVRRILKQVDGHAEIFTGESIVVMTDLYHELEDASPRESVSQRTPAVKLADVLSGFDGLVLGAKDRLGVSRPVTQARKLFRINQYLQEPKEDLDERVEILTSRPMSVSHRAESDFIIDTYDAAEDFDKDLDRDVWLDRSRRLNEIRNPELITNESGVSVSGARSGSDSSL